MKSDIALEWMQYKQVITHFILTEKLEKPNFLALNIIENIKVK